MGCDRRVAGSSSVLFVRFARFASLRFGPLARARVPRACRFQITLVRLTLFLCLTVYTYDFHNKPFNDPNETQRKRTSDDDADEATTAVVSNVQAKVFAKTR